MGECFTWVVAIEGDVYLRRCDDHEVDFRSKVKDWPLECPVAVHVAEAVAREREVTDRIVERWRLLCEANCLTVAGAYFQQLAFDLDAIRARGTDKEPDGV